ncbi:hypothetical protein SESBI_25634 [Sesbania bispinosa]|nr:hypothetical protein SESBI_25634 [Sesbania bispinosa]
MVGRPTDSKGQSIRKASRLGRYPARMDLHPAETDLYHARMVLYSDGRIAG